ncbi:fimbrillin family protein [Bacteroides sp. 519]|uniref:fimbrillin family protein n=1 Tax=Bacteroides sp. 519 TaxID=2302937 RepID=UPI0013D24031|nr:fimbrillin family protein [Bacteroides sp. 519]NDV58332.1 hypothetical protein [Bacteroides sp. 519]
MKQLNLVFALLLTVAFIACSDDNEEVQEKNVDPGTIQLIPSITGAEVTRGEPENQTTTDIDYVGNFRLLAVETNTGTTPTSYYDTPLLKVETAGGRAVYADSGTHYDKRWPVNDGSLILHAYAPPSAFEGVFTGITTVPTFNANAEYNFGTYTLPDVTNQKDLLFAYIGTGSRTTVAGNFNKGKVSFTFEHLLSRVTFEVRKAETGFLNNDKVYVTEIGIRQVFGTATGKTNNSKIFEWSTRTSPSNYTVQPTTGVEITKTNFDTDEYFTTEGAHQTITQNKNNSLFMLPHSTTEFESNNSVLYIKFRVGQTYATASNGEDIEWKQPLKDKESWESGKWVNYRFTINPNYIEVEAVKVKGWNKVNVPLEVH